MLKRRSIFVKLIVPLILLIALSIGTEVLLVSMRSASEASDLALELAKENVHRYGASLTAVGNEAEASVTTLAASVSSLRDRNVSREDVIEVMKGSISNFTDIRSVWLGFESGKFDAEDSRFDASIYMNEDGEAFYSPQVQREGVDISFEEMYGENYNKVYVSEPHYYIHEDVQDVYISVSAAISEDGVYLGAVGVDIGVTLESQHMSLSEILNNSDIFFISPDGLFVLCSDDAQTLQYYSLSWMGRFADDFSTLMGHHDIFQSSAYNPDKEETCVLTAQAIHFAGDEKPWIIGTIVPESSITSVSRTMLMLIIGGGILILLIVIFELYVVMSQNLVGLRGVINAAERLARGDIDIYFDAIDDRTTKDEVQLITKSFSSLVDTTRDQVTDIERIADGDYKYTVQPRSDKDRMNYALNNMAQNLDFMFSKVVDTQRVAEEEHLKNKLANEAKSNFLIDSSREMMSPLTTVIGLTELVLEEDTLKPDSRAHIETVYAASMALLSIVNDVRDISRIESGRFALSFQEYSTTTLFGDIVAVSSLKTESKDVKLDVRVDSNIPTTLYGDSLRLKQIFNNLLSYSIEVTSKGTITWNISGEQAGGTFWLISTIEDTSGGTDRSDVDRIFGGDVDLSASARLAEKGPTLSLMIARQLVEIMEGSLSIKSMPGYGNLFTLSLRQDVSNAAPIGESGVAALTSPVNIDLMRRKHDMLVRNTFPGRRALIVDDLPSNRDVLKGLFGPYGITVDTASSGEEAIDLIRDSFRRYDIILLDHMLPGMDGIETAAVIRKLGTKYVENIPIIALTNKAFARNDSMFIDNGFQGCLSKPIDILALDTIIRMWIK